MVKVKTLTHTTSLKTAIQIAQSNYIEPKTTPYGKSSSYSINGTFNLNEAYFGYDIAVVFEFTKEIFFENYKATPVFYLPTNELIRTPQYGIDPATKIWQQEIYTNDVINIGNANMIYIIQHKPPNSTEQHLINELINILDNYLGLPTKIIKGTVELQKNVVKEPLTYQEILLQIIRLNHKMFGEPPLEIVKRFTFTEYLYITAYNKDIAEHFNLEEIYEELAEKYDDW